MTSPTFPPEQRWTADSIESGWTGWYCSVSVGGQEAYLAVRSCLVLRARKLTPLARRAARGQAAVARKQQDR